MSNPTVSKYPLDEPLELAIRKLFEDPGDGLLALGLSTVPLCCRSADSSPEKSVAERAQSLRSILEDYVILYAAELEEFDSKEDALRIRSEARAVLIALREIHRHFPDV